MSISGQVQLFSGGTALGAVQIFPAQQIRRATGQQAAAYAGVSVGATLSLLAGQDRLTRAESLWREVDGTKFFQNTQIDVWNGLYDLKPLLQRVLVEAQHKIVTPCWVGVYDYAADVYRSIPLHELGSAQEIAEAVTCSAAQPFIHQGRQCKVERGGQYRWCGDGGVKHVLPLVPPGVEPTEIHAIFCSPISRINPVPSSEVDKAWEQGTRALSALVDRVVADDYKRLQTASCPVTVYAPKEYPGDPFDAKRQTILWRLEVIGKQLWEQAQRVGSVDDGGVGSVGGGGGGVGVTQPYTGPVTMSVGKKPKADKADKADKSDKATPSEGSTP